MLRKIMRIGNSVGVTLPKKMLRLLGLDGVIWLAVDADTRGKRIILRKRKKNEW